MIARMVTLKTQAPIFVKNVPVLALPAIVVWISARLAIDRVILLISSETPVLTSANLKKQ